MAAGAMPNFLPNLLNEEVGFFEPCQEHNNPLPKTFFCIKCCSCACDVCRTNHQGHDLLQSFPLGLTSLVLLHKRSGVLSTGPNPCCTCSHGPRAHIRYCSLACKAAGAMSDWLHNLLNEGVGFFELCQVHNSKTNFFCIQCGSIACNKCLKNHSGHAFLQILKYQQNGGYGIRVDQLSAHFNCDLIQSYSRNPNPTTTRLVLLHKRPRVLHTGDNVCPTCGQNHRYRAPNIYCSISCKVDQLLKLGKLNEHVVHSPH